MSLRNNFLTHVALLFTCVSHAAEPLVAARKESRGMVLDVALDYSARSWKELNVSCRVTNESSNTVGFSYASRGGAFGIELIDPNGKEVERQPGHEQSFRAYDKGVFGSFRGGRLPPHGSDVIAFRLLDIFKVGEPNGYSLRVLWDPGPNGRERYPVDKNLTVELRVPNVLLAAAVDQPVSLPKKEQQLVSATKTESVTAERRSTLTPRESGASPADANKNYPAKTASWWQWAVLAIVFLAIVAWWARRKRDEKQ